MSRILGAVVVALGLAVLAPGLARAAYWDFQGTLHDYPTVQYEYGESNPDQLGNWGIRISRSNCEAKLLLAERASGNVVQTNIPGGCSNLDASIYYNAHFYWASDARNTDTGPGDVFVNVRIDFSL